MWFLYIQAAIILAMDITVIKLSKKDAEGKKHKNLNDHPVDIARLAIAIFAVFYSVFFIASQFVIDLPSMTLAAIILTAMYLLMAWVGWKNPSKLEAEATRPVDVMTRIFVWLSAVYSVAFIALAAIGR